MIEENTKFEGDYSKRKEDEELEIWFINEIKKRFTQYEISNFGKICLHNLGYWQGKEYLGIGAGAVGFKKWKMKNWVPKKSDDFLGQKGEWKIFRYYTKRDVYKYLKNPINYEYEYLSDEDIKKEKIFLGLRSIIGFEENILSKNEKQKVLNLIQENKLYKKDNKIFSYDFLLADALTQYILD